MAGGLFAGLVRAARPRQWIKNLLVFAAPLAGGVLLEQQALRASLVALLSFVAASSATYLTNDILDIEADRRHPQKRHRPLASGEVPVVPAALAAGVLALGSVAVPFLIGLESLSALIIAYLTVQVVYFLWAKDQPVFDLAAVATGFVLRAVAGGVAAGLEISVWFLTVTASVAVFVVAGKRYSELVNQGDSGTRAILAKYTGHYLRYVWSVASAVAIVFYALWSVDLVDRGGGAAARLSVIPFTLILLRYARDVDAATAESPEKILLGDGGLIALGLIWASLFLFQLAA